MRSLEDLHLLFSLAGMPFLVFIQCSRTPSKVTCWSGLGQGQSSEVLVLQSQAQNPVPQVKKPVSGLRAQDPERTGLQCLPFAIHSTLAWRRGPQGMPPCAVTHLALRALVLPLLVSRTLLHPSVTPPPPPPGPPPCHLASSRCPTFWATGSSPTFWILPPPLADPLEDSFFPTALERRSSYLGAIILLTTSS